MIKGSHCVSFPLFGWWIFIHGPKYQACYSERNRIGCRVLKIGGLSIVVRKMIPGGCVRIDHIESREHSDGWDVDYVFVVKAR